MAPTGKKFRLVLVHSLIWLGIGVIFCQNRYLLSTEVKVVLDVSIVDKETRPPQSSANDENQTVNSDFSNSESHDDKESLQRIDKKYCTREEIQKGHWSLIQRPEAPYTATETWESKCYIHGARAGDLLKKPFQDYEWLVPSDCIYNQFDINRFCQIVGNRTIALFGDSLAYQQYNSLVYITNATEKIRERAQCLSTVCNNKLVWKRDNSASARGMNIMIRQMDPEIIVFNRGAHFTDDQKLIQELTATLEVALVWQQDCDKRKRNCILLWRSTAPGFPACSEYQSPLTDPSKAKDIIKNMSWYEKDEQRLQYHWWDFSTQNTLVEGLIQRYVEQKQLRIHFLDFYDMAILRPDNHASDSDCLHWCLPGPMDAVNTLLLHMLEKENFKRNQ